MSVSFVKYFMEKKTRTSQNTLYKEFINDNEVSIMHYEKGLIYHVNTKSKTLIVNAKDTSNDSWIAWARQNGYRVLKGEKYEV